MQEQELGTDKLVLSSIAQYLNVVEDLVNNLRISDSDKEQITDKLDSASNLIFNAKRLSQ